MLQVSLFACTTEFMVILTENVRGGARLEAVQEWMLAPLAQRGVQFKRTGHVRLS